MKLEPRGKYAGIKVHLDGPEVENVLSTGDNTVEAQEKALIFVKDLRKAIKGEMKKFPDLLTDKTPEQVAEMLVHEAEKAQAKLAALQEGKDWTKVKGFGK